MASPVDNGQQPGGGAIEFGRVFDGVLKATVQSERQADKIFGSSSVLSQDSASYIGAGKANPYMPSQGADAARKADLLSLNHLDTSPDPVAGAYKTAEMIKHSTEQNIELTKFSYYRSTALMFGSVVSGVVRGVRSLFTGQ